MLTVAVTGGIGAGKSTVSGMLADLGAVVVDSDRLARDVVAPGTDGLAEVVSEFGRGTLTDDAALDRAALAQIVFHDDAARRRLEAITHPRIRAEFDRRRAAAPAGAVVVNDIPLVRTDAEAAAFDEVVVVTAAEDVRVARLVARGLEVADARARIAAQITDRERERFAHVVIPNDRGQDELRARVDALWARWSRGSAGVVGTDQSEPAT